MGREQQEFHRECDMRETRKLWEDFELEVPGRKRELQEKIDESPYENPDEKYFSTMCEIKEDFDLTDKDGQVMKFHQGEVWAARAKRFCLGGFQCHLEGRLENGD